MQATREIFRPALDERQADGSGFGAARRNLAKELAGVPAQALPFGIFLPDSLPTGGGGILVTSKIKQSSHAPR